MKKIKAAKKEKNNVIIINLEDKIKKFLTIYSLANKMIYN